MNIKWDSQIKTIPLLFCQYVSYVLGIASMSDA